MIGLRIKAAILLAIFGTAVAASPTRASEPETAVGAVIETLESGDTQRALVAVADLVERLESRFEHDPETLATLLHQLGQALFDFPGPSAAEAWGRAEELLGRAADLRERAAGPNDLILADMLQQLSTLYFYQGRWALNERLDRRVLAIRSEALGDEHPDVVETRMDLAQTLLQQGRYEDSEELNQEALSALRRHPDPDPYLLANGLNIQGELRRLRGEYELAEATFREAIAPAEAVADEEPLIEDVLNNLALCLQDQGLYDEAETTLLRSLRVAEDWAESYPDDLAGAHLNLAELYRRQGRWSEAEPRYTLALETVRELLGPSTPQLVFYLNSLAIFYRDQRRWAEAEPLFREALQVMEDATVDSPLLRPETEYNLAELLRSTGRPEEARALYRSSLEAREEAFGRDHPWVAQAQLGLALTQPETPEGRLAARSLLERSSSVLERSAGYPESAVEALAARARLSAGSETPETALPILARAIGRVEEMRPRAGGGEEARAGFFERYVDLYHLMVEWQLGRGRLEEAFEYAERARARALVDQLEAAGFDLRASVPAELRLPLERRERRIESGLIESRTQLQLTAGRGDLPAAERRSRVEELEREIDSQARELRAVSNELRASSPIWRDLLTSQGVPATLEQVQASLVPAQGLLLFYQVGSRESHLFVIPPAGSEPEVARLEVSTENGRALGIEGGELTSEKLLTALLSSDSAAPGTPVGLVAALQCPRGLGDPETAPDPASLERSRLHALWQVLIPPALRDRVLSAGEAIVVPDGALHLLPFEALVIAPSGRDDEASYWLDEGPMLRYAPSTTTLLSLTARAASRPPASELSVLVVADPVFDPAELGAPGVRGRSDGAEAGPASCSRYLAAGGRLDRLPATAREADSIRKAFESGPRRATVSVLARLSAREARLRREIQTKPQILHFATHGIVDERRSELRSALALTPPGGEATGTDDDGLLQLFEIYELDLPAELAVLSACETHLGRRVRGEGVFALSRGFLAAGTVRVIASQWPVADESTSVLMGELYRRLASAAVGSGGPDYARALHEARLALRNDERWKSPYYWAPFILVGPA